MPAQASYPRTSRIHGAYSWRILSSAEKYAADPGSPSTQPHGSAVHCSIAACFAG